MPLSLHALLSLSQLQARSDANVSFEIVSAASLPLPLSRRHQAAVGFQGGGSPLSDSTQMHNKLTMVVNV